MTVIYARYSSDSQTEQSIEGQVRVCKQFAEKNDLLVVDSYIDRATTGTNDNRAAFQQMLRDSKKAQWGAVIVYKLDRFARNKYESVVNRKKLKDNGVELVSAMENIPDTPEGKLFLAVIEGVNEYFSEDLKQKVNRGLRESWLKGNATGASALRVRHQRQEIRHRRSRGGNRARDIYEIRARLQSRRHCRRPESAECPSQMRQVYQPQIRLYHLTRQKVYRHCRTSGNDLLQHLSAHYYKGAMESSGRNQPRKQNRAEQKKRRSSTTYFRESSFAETANTA